MRIITIIRPGKHIAAFSFIALLVFILLSGINSNAFADHSNKFKFHHPSRIGNVITGAVYDPHEDNFIRYNADTDNEFSIRSNDVNTIIEDRSENIWVFCTSGEIEKFDPKSKALFITVMKQKIRKA
ncbi:hypothetical protein QUF70_04965 [Desulfobacterales bacterium HSG17]|nr:hypothetical protein [Desulfobacterales bacterium HSG17]